MAYLSPSIYPENDLYECSYCNQRYPAQEELAIHEYIHGNYVREAIFSLTIQPRNSFLLYENFTYACGKLKSGVFGKEIGCAETPEQDENDGKLNNSEDYHDASTGVSYQSPKTHHQDFEYSRHDPSKTLFKYKTFHRDTALFDSEESVNKLESMSACHLVKYETFPKMTARIHDQDLNYKTSFSSFTESTSEPHKTFLGIRRCNSAFILEQRFALCSGSR